MTTSTHIQVNVYSYPEHQFLGQRHVPKIFDDNGGWNTAPEAINGQVNEVRKLHGKTAKTSYFKTTENF